jgi:hypothetical protein
MFPQPSPLDGQIRKLLYEQVNGFIAHCLSNCSQMMPASQRANAGCWPLRRNKPSN